MLLDPPQAIPNAAYLIYRYLRYAAEGHRASKEQIIRELAPESLTSNDAVCRFSVQSGAALGLWAEQAGAGRQSVKTSQTAGKEQQDPVLILSEDLLTSPADGPKERESFRLVLTRHIFDPARNPGPWLSQVGAYDFTCAIAWLLAQDVANPPGTWESLPRSTVPSVQQRQIEQLGNSQEAWLIKGMDRWNPMVRWASYLGLISRQVVDGKVLVAPSPVDAVAGALPAVFLDGASTELAAEHFVSALAAELPVLDGGTYRQEVMAHLTSAALRPDEGQLSSSLSHALLILHERGDIGLEDRPDAPKVGLTNGPRGLMAFSHVRMNRGAES